MQFVQAARWHCAPRSPPPSGLSACPRLLISALSVGRGGAEAAAAAAAEHATDIAEADLLSNLPEKLDEFGRDENVELREEMSRRAHKRATEYSHPPAQPQVCCCWPVSQVALTPACIALLLCLSNSRPDEQQNLEKLSTFVSQTCLVND